MSLITPIVPDFSSRGVAVPPPMMGNQVAPPEKPIVARPKPKPISTEPELAAVPRTKMSGSSYTVSKASMTFDTIATTPTSAFAGASLPVQVSYPDPNIVRSQFSPNTETFPTSGTSYFITDSNIQADVAKWSIYPAISTVQMNSNSLLNVNSMTGFLCQMSTIQALSAVVTPHVLTNTLRVGTGAITLIDNTGNHVLEAIGGDLFFDTELLAKAGDIQNVADWALYPAFSSIDMQNELITEPGGGYIDLATSLWNSRLAGNEIYLSPATHVQIGSIIDNNSMLWTNDIAAIGQPAGTVGQYLTHNGSTIMWAAAPPATSNWSQYAAISTINADNNDIIGVQKINGIAYPPAPTDWANYPATSTINAANNDITGVLKINGIAYPPPASGVASVNGQTGAVTITGDVSTITATLIGSDTQLGAPTLGTSGDLYPVNDTSWGKANYASLNATSAGLAAGGAATAAAAAQASADAAAITAGAALADATAALAQSGITSVNGGSYAATIAAGSGIGVATTFSSGTTNPTVTISATGTAGVASLNTLSGALNLVAGTNTSVVSSGGNTLTINNTGTAGVTTLNTLAGALTLAAGAGISVTPSGGDTLTLANTVPAGVTTLNTLAGALNLVAGTNTSVVSSGGNTLTINNTGTAGVTTLNTLAGALTLAAGAGISVTPSGGNTLTLANTVPGTSFVASYDIYVAPNGNDTTGTGSANNPYLTIAKAILQRATISTAIEVSIRLASGTYAESAILIANTYLVGVVTGEADQPVNITGNITMNGATGQSGIVGLQLNAPTSDANVTISGAGTFAINNCNITAGVSASPASYILNQTSAGTGTCYMTECRATCSATNSVEGISCVAGTLIMRDCAINSAGQASIILSSSNLVVRQCNITSTYSGVSSKSIISFNPVVVNKTCEVSYSVLQYTSAATSALKGCIVVSNGAATALVNIVNNLLICEGTTNGSPGNYNCIWKTAASAGNACTMSYGNLLGGATAHSIDANITKTQYVTVP